MSNAKVGKVFRDGVLRRAARRAAAAIKSRRIQFEKLEDRNLLAGDWQNPLLSLDVNADTFITTRDVLDIINKLNRTGPGALPTLQPGERPERYYDTSGDGVITANDVLRAINGVNAILANGDTYRLTDMKSLSSHYIQATFSAPIQAGLLSPEAYVLTGPDQERLQILGVAEGESPNTVVLTTAAQAPVSYSVSMDPAVLNAVSIVGSIKGDSAHEPFLETAIALDNATVLLTFSDPMDADTANIEQFYRIVAANGNTPAGDVGSVGISQADVNGRTVMLHTSPLENVEYQVRVTNVFAEEKTNSNGRLIDPTRNSGTFFGIPPSQGLALSSAVPLDDATILLSFSEPVAGITVNPAKFLVQKVLDPVTGELAPDPLLVTGSEVSQQGTRVTLTTLPHELSRHRQQRDRAGGEPDQPAHELGRVRCLRSRVRETDSVRRDSDQRNVDSVVVQ